MTESEPKIPAKVSPAEQAKIKLEQFRQKIAGLKEEERVIGKSAHLDSINPELLDEKDMQAYEAISNFDLNAGEITELLKIITIRREELAPMFAETTEKAESQKAFLAYLSNLVQGRMDKDLYR